MKGSFGWKGTMGILIGGMAALFGGLEIYTLTDDIADNHITAAIRQMFDTDIGVIVGGFLLLAFGAVAGHLFPKWGGGKSKK